VHEDIRNVDKLHALFACIQALLPLKPIQIVVHFKQCDTSKSELRILLACCHNYCILHTHSIVYIPVKSGAQFLVNLCSSYEVCT